MLLAIGVTAEAAVFARARFRAVAGMTTITGRVLSHLMQPRQLRRLVAALAVWRRGNAARAMRAVAIGASRADLAMRGAGLLGMT